MDYDYNEEKSNYLKESRGVDFEDIIDAIENGKLISDIPHFKKSNYKNQRLFLVKIKDYIYVVPYIKNTVKNLYFLKTIYPSRRFTKIYLKK